MITKKDYIVIIAYLAAKLEAGEEWFAEPNAAFFGKSPYELVVDGKGDFVIEYLEIRLGLRPGAAF